MDLEILPVRPPELKKKKKEIHPNLPQIFDSGRLISIIGAVKSGKTVLMQNIVLRFYEECFDIVYVISPSVFNDPSARFMLERYPDTCFSEYSDELIDRILNYQMSFVSKGQSPPDICLVIDDFTGINSNSKIFHLATRYRHYGIRLLMFASQVFRCLPTSVRTNTSTVLISRTPNAKELEKLSEEYGPLCGGDAKFMELYHEATKGDYNWLNIDLASNPTKVYKNFTDLIYTGDR